MWLSRHEDAKHATQDSSGQWKQYNLIVRNATSRNDEMTFAVMVTEMGLETVHAAASVASAPYYCGRAHWLKITTIACSSSSSSTSCHCHCYSLGHYRHRYRATAAAITVTTATATTSVLVLLRQLRLLQSPIKLFAGWPRQDRPKAPLRRRGTSKKQKQKGLV